MNSARANVCSVVGTSLLFNYRGTTSEYGLNSCRNWGFKRRNESWWGGKLALLQWQQSFKPGSSRDLHPHQVWPRPFIAGGWGLLRLPTAAGHAAPAARLGEAGHPCGGRGPGGGGGGSWVPSFMPGRKFGPFPFVQPSLQCTGREM